MFDSTIFQPFSKGHAHKKQQLGVGRQAREPNDVQVVDRGDDLFQTQATNQQQVQYEQVDDQFLEEQPFAAEE